MVPFQTQFDEDWPLQVHRDLQHRSLEDQQASHIHQSIQTT